MTGSGLAWASVPLPVIRGQLLEGNGSPSRAQHWNDGRSEPVEVAEAKARNGSLRSRKLRQDSRHPRAMKPSGARFLTQPGRRHAAGGGAQKPGEALSSDRPVPLSAEDAVVDRLKIVPLRLPQLLPEPTPWNFRKTVGRRGCKRARKGPAALPDASTA